MSDAIVIPDRLADACAKTAERRAWLAELPETVTELAERWAAEIVRPFPDATAAWVAPATRADGTEAVVKVGMPHFEADHEIDGLRFWAGDPTVRVLEADPEAGAALLERCLPGTPLRELPEREQDVVIAGLIRRLWQVVDEPHPFRPLAFMTARWAEETQAAEDRWRDAGLVRDGLALFAELPANAPTAVLLGTDVHAGNVLRAEREPWLVIDPKPFVGDPAYDATQHLFNSAHRMLGDLDGTIRRFAELLEVDSERVRLWMFARMVAEPGPPDAEGVDWLDVARRLSP